MVSLGIYLGSLRMIRGFLIREQEREVTFIPKEAPPLWWFMGYEVFKF